MKRNNIKYEISDNEGKVYTPTCTRCHHRYPIASKTGLPTMVGFGLMDGRTINLCRKCLDILGACKDDKERDEFFRGLK